MKKVVPVLVLAFAVSCAFVSCKPKEQKELEGDAKVYGDALKTTEDTLDALGEYEVPVFPEESPMEYQQHSYYGDVKIRGKIFPSFKEVIKAFHEQDGWAYIEGYGEIHFWLYDTYTNFDGKGSILIDYFYDWTLRKGYSKPYDRRTVSPDQDVPSSVKTLMNQRNCDVAFALITSDTSYPYDESPYMVVHSYDRDRGYYWTYIYPVRNHRDNYRD